MKTFAVVQDVDPKTVRIINSDTGATHRTVSFGSKVISIQLNERRANVVTWGPIHHKMSIVDLESGRVVRTVTV